MQGWTTTELRVSGEQLRQHDANRTLRKRQTRTCNLCYSAAPTKRSGPTLCRHTKSTLKPQPSEERMKLMANHSSATVREPHATRTSRTNTIINALKRRAQAVVNDKSIDPRSRAILRYALEVNDPWLARLVRRADAGESIAIHSISRKHLKPTTMIPTSRRSKR